MERYVLIDNYCGWPTLIAMPDGSLLMSVYNKPSHGGMNGEAECWRSTDGGRSFQMLCAPFGRDPGRGQANDCLGLAHNGDILEVLTCDRGRGPAVYRSSDGGRSFRMTCEELRFDAIPGSGTRVMFGHVAQVPGGKTLAMQVWTHDPSGDSNESRSFVCFSDDDGDTWTRCYPIGTSASDLNNETALLFFDADHGIAVCRTSAYGAFVRRDENGRLFTEDARCTSFHYNDCLTQYRTRDGGRTWKFEGAVTGTQSHPANLIKLRDGGILLTYGCRWKPISFICAQYSGNQGLTWEPPQVLAMYESCDGGYPSSAQNPDGSICTAYYVQAAAYHTHYHVASVVWRPEEMINDAWIAVNGLGGPYFVRQGKSLYESKPEDILNPDWQFIV